MASEHLTEITRPLRLLQDADPQPQIEAIRRYLQGDADELIRAADELSVALQHETSRSELSVHREAVNNRAMALVQAEKNSRKLKVFVTTAAILAGPMGLVGAAIAAGVAGFILADAGVELVKRLGWNPIETVTSYLEYKEDLHATAARLPPTSFANYANLENALSSFARMIQNHRDLPIGLPLYEESRDFRVEQFNASKVAGLIEEMIAYAATIYSSDGISSVLLDRNDVLAALVRELEELMQTSKSVHEWSKGTRVNFVGTKAEAEGSVGVVMYNIHVKDVKDWSCLCKKRTVTVSMKKTAVLYPSEGAFREQLRLVTAYFDSNAN
eukprot:CAMPEP_0202895708 /NCGR_PEP_ID=MMETSP1392-20130828/4864_1 /ASSEMBLY_ACC=CAM_ASM_000868 /TAXON_ID=225041 /ORGANISM="Chlamydomonas chlamydogama, Strain SAG 11-48b" /LENGTH=327 /DNA_ID=CAMNT_0049580825 /DNA_START=109 /DNA_END=1092 /DNA_ORIENTATION=-